MTHILFVSANERGPEDRLKLDMPTPVNYRDITKQLGDFTHNRFHFPKLPAEHYIDAAWALSMATHTGVGQHPNGTISVVRDS